MIIWVASYPKSGNTWVRSFLISLLSGKDLDINNLSLIPQYPKEEHFKEITNDVNDIIEVSKKWIKSQEIINKDKQIKFFKTHNMLCNIGENYFTNERNTLGSIYIVRDPRNVVTSLKNHYQFEDYNDAINFMFDEKKYLGSKYNKEENSVPTLIGSWKSNYNSWKILNKNLLIIKYENLINNEFSEFKKISSYIENMLGKKFKESEVKSAINNSSFSNLKKMENKDGFVESPINKKTGDKQTFFNLGPKNKWKNLLEKKLVEQIESEFSVEMKELNYI